MTNETATTAGAERARLAAVDAGREAWRRWGPYVSERAWGTVREDYSESGEAWSYFPHDHARSRAYRWSEDGLAGVCDERQTWCLALSLWNGVDPILKERIFGLTGPEGNHGEDAKDYWWYVAATPTSSWLRWRYHYPQRAFPYAELIAQNARRGKDEPEYELVDTGAFADDRYWIVKADYAKAAPDDLCLRIRVTNRGPDAATLHLLPTLWFRNTWAWGRDPRLPSIRALANRLVATDVNGGTLTLVGDGAPTALTCDNETNTQRLFGVPGRSAYPKDGINDHVVSGAATVNPAGTGTKGALWYRLTVPPGATHEVRLRLTTGEAPDADLGKGFAAVMAARETEAEEFYDSVIPAAASPDERRVARQSFAGMLWGKQFFSYDVDTWLDGDPGQPQPPSQRRTGRNAGWRHLNNFDVISMPDKWEYPWYAAWDLAFHCVALALVDPSFAKEQLLLLCREWYMHPNGQLPAYEWSFGDVNPPVHAWAALRVFEIDGGRDYDFLERILHKLLLNFTWWVNRKDSVGNNVFEGGFLGLDNIGPIDRSAALPVAGRLEQSDGTAWMAMYCLDLLEMALVLAEHDESYEDLATKFFEHFAYIGCAMREQGLWDESDRFFYDVLHLADGRRIPLRVRSMVGLLPLCATTTLGRETLARLPDFARRMRWFLRNKPQYADVVGAVRVRDGAEGRLLSIVGEDRLVPVLERMLDADEFLSPHGLRALSRAHRDEPFVLDCDGASFAVDYEPGESTSGLFGGNSNWRGPIWFPANYLLVEAIRRFARYFGDDLLVEHPTCSGQQRTLSEVADDLSRRLVGIFLESDGSRPVFGNTALFQDDQDWHDLLPFHEYFHGETGAGLGAAHQTGWTGLVANLVLDLYSRSPE
ncbi:MAG: MGH1-like glycoside hydrolase domain-containing protein [Mycobacterium leprae]